MMSRVFKNKRFLLVAGLAIGLVTLFSHSLRVEIRTGKNQATEQTSGANQKTVIVTPSDAVTVNFFTLQVDVSLAITPVFQPVKKVFKVIPVFQRKISSYYQTLFRYIISPNAP
jgi:hypothetical protein